MNQNLEKKEMKDFVVQYFIRVCKNHRIYSKFRTSFEKVKRSRDGNPFGPFTNIFDFKDCLEQFTEKEYNHHRRTDDKYEKVKNLVLSKFIIAYTYFRCKQILYKSLI